MAASADSKFPSCKNCPAWSRSAFAGLDDHQLARLQEEKTETRYERGDPLSQKGQPTENVYCLRSGSAKVTLVDEKTGKESLVRLAGPGDLLGYRCIFSEQAFRGTASALNESVACRINSPFLFRLIGESPAFSLELLRRMGKEVASAEYHHHSFCQKNVRERLAEALLILNEKFGENSSLGRKINTHLSRVELANWIGASRETVIRGLAEFSVEGLIQQEDEFIHILDLPGLVGLSGISHSAPELRNSTPAAAKATERPFP